MTATVRALKAFGRNDLRGTFREPLLVMIVLAPVIWTASVRIVTPMVEDMLKTRYGFDLVPYYPLILTAFLLLTTSSSPGVWPPSSCSTNSTRARSPPFG